MKDLKKDKKFVKEFFNMPYPKFIHGVGLYNDAEYINGLCSKFLHNRKELNFKILDYSADEKAKLYEKIKETNNKELLNYYIKMLKSIEILKKYYNLNETKNKKAKF